jgi:methionyl-tRNA formyltransferase
VRTLASPEASVHLREICPDVAVSLGNRLLPVTTYGVPRLGTVNVHLGSVPDYRGGPPVFWELADGRDRVGYTIHRMDVHIDTGPVFAAGDLPIHHRSTLKETLAATLPPLHVASVDALAAVLAALARQEITGSPQDGYSQRMRTAPGLRDYILVHRMLRNLERSKHDRRA